ncbi:hypothetical protein H0H81_000424 [Sphagnurus paluster]|uniref:Uncharacterized protein n=1 Tax=Sphagnurus paluster TaxID=117069 RepID=A0A9P7FQ12_9AGAR|nr:hypothetical protein H0H81_000424 [Sphagnurus paluster]
MVQLVLSSTKVVRTKIDADAKQLLAQSITISVRCYESRLGRVSVLHSNVLVDYTQVLWSKPDADEYAPIDDLEFPFRITVPANVAGFSTSVFVDYRCMWRVEAVLTHVPISGVGSRQVKHFELPLVRYDLPPHEPTLPPPPKPLLLHQTTKPKAPRVRYTIHAPTSPIGPLDIVAIPVYLFPLDENVSIRSATVMIERRIHLNETSSPDTQPSLSNPPSPRPSPASSLSSRPNSGSPSYQEHAPQKFNSVATVSSDVSSNTTITPHSMYPTSGSTSSDSPLLPLASSSTPHHPVTASTSHSSTSLPSKSIITPVVGAESSGTFTRDESGIASKTVTLQWPSAKSPSRWAIGETIQSDLVSVRFFARVKISVSSPNGTESIELGEKELLIVSTNTAERQLALAKYNDLLNSYAHGRSKSKSPRRTKYHGAGDDLPPPPPPYKKGMGSTGSVTGGQATLSPKVATPRRPHTSAGPRDSPRTYDFAGAQTRMVKAGYYEQRSDGGETFGRHQGQGQADTKRAGAPESKRRSGVVGSLFASAPRITTAFSGSSNGTTSTSSPGSGSGSVTRSTSSVSSTGGEMDVGPDERMREWEEELAKIEARSRRSSDMLGFSGKRKQPLRGVQA